MRIKAILFDLDGTLVNSNDMHIEAWEKAFSEIGHRFERSAIHEQIGKGADMLVPALLPDLDKATQSKLGKREGQIFKETYLEQVRPFPAAHRLLAEVHRRGQRIVMATSSSDDQLDHYVGLLEARDFVAGTTSSGDVKNTKPAPDIFAVALKRVPDIFASEALAVGDTPYDIEAAKKNGVGTVALRSGGFPDEALLDAGALALYDDVETLLDDYDQSPLGR